MKRKLKIVLSLLVVAALCVVFVAAKGKKEAKPKKEGFVIGWSNAGMGDSWRQFLVANFNAEVAKHQEIKTSYVTNADEKPEKQIADIDDLLVKGIDILIVYPRWGTRSCRRSSARYSSGIR